MSARHFYRVVGGTTLIEQTLIPREGWEVKSAAEEGTTPMVAITIPDPNSELDYMGHRKWMIVEDESEDTDDVLFFGYTADQEIGRVGGELEEPLGRVWVVSLTDANTVWQRRVMTGTDCKRPAETDVQRMQWLLATNEATSWFENVTDFVFTSSPVDMDKVDYRGQMFNQIADDCAQASGKNWYTFYRNNGSARELCAWYGSDGREDYASELSLSNDPADFDDAAMIDGTATVWPISYDTKLNRSPDRVYDGVYEPYDSGAVYRKNAATGLAFDHRDFVAPSLNVKTKAKAAARAIRYLNDLDEQDERVTTTVRLPKAKATKIKAGMRVQFKATHFPGYEAFGWMRVVDCTPKPVAAGAYYDLALTLVGPSTAPDVCSGSGYALTADGYYPPLGSTTTDSSAVIYYFRAGLIPPTHPQPGYAGDWHFGSYGYSSGLSPSGTFDEGFGFTGLGNSVIIIVIGNSGTLTVHTVDYASFGAGLHINEINYLGGFEPGTTGIAGTPMVLTVDPPTVGNDCIRIFAVTADDDTGFAGVTWAAS